MSGSRECLGASPARSEHYPPRESVQIDKRNREWMLTAWPTADTTLRIRIRHAGPVAPSEFFCEIAQVQTDYDFVLLTHFLWWRERDSASFEWPTSWQVEFVSLARVWTACLELAEWGLAMGDTPMVRDEADPYTPAGANADVARATRGEDPEREALCGRPRGTEHALPDQVCDADAR
jgi:hypothetical protein